MERGGEVEEESQVLLGFSGQRATVSSRLSLCIRKTVCKWWSRKLIGGVLVSYTPVTCLPPSPHLPPPGD